MIGSSKLLLVLCAMCLLSYNGASGKEFKDAVEKDSTVLVGHKLKCFELPGSGPTISSGNNEIPAAVESCRNCCSDHHYLISVLTKTGICYCDDVKTAEQMPKDDTMIITGYKLKCFSLPADSKPNNATVVKNCKECCSNNNFPISIVTGGTNCYCDEAKDV